MASKRKSTVPCMIPSKSKHVREEIILGSLPELLPTIPEDSILSISGEDAGHFSHSSSKPERGSEMQKGGTYSCPPCRFESRDLNYFLDHMHKCHVDFQAQPTFYCLNCGVSVVRFEKLALHNANAHPRIMEGSVTASLSVSQRDGVTSVEQSLFTDGAQEHKEAGISLTKTPIAKMMKAKGEHKKIVVSHTVEVRKIPPGKDVDPSMLTNVPELQNGAQAMPRTTVAHLITTTVSNQVFHQHTPSLYSPPSSDSNKDLPKVMIPLSSIPTYDAAMDTSSFLKTSFGKFPYPTKAELCYLTVVSEFPEEQIKLWFTAQRLKQGISWSPEEIEEARRKMFNTVFQGGAPQKQPAAPRHVNHVVTHHTVAAQPGSKGPNFQMTKVPYGSLKNRSIGVVATQASMSTNPHVTRVSYSTPILPQKFPSLARTTQAPTKNTQPTAESDKSNGLGLDGGVGGVGGVNNTSSSCSSSNGGDAVSRKAAERMDSAASVSNNDEHCAAETNGKPTNAPSDSSPVGPEGADGTKGHVIVNNTSKFNNHSGGDGGGDGGGGGSQEQSSAPKVEDGGERTSSSSSSSSSGHPSPPRADGPSLNHASKAQTESTSTTVITKSSSYVLDEFPIKGMSILQQLIKDDDPPTGDRSCPELKIDPINLKRLKMNEAEAASDTERTQEHKSEAADAPQTSFSPPWANKNPQQLHVLRQVFSGTRWPSSQQYEELSVQTGLPKSEVVRWFSDSRYSHKNGQLKWLETYRRPEPEEGRGHRGAGADSPKDPPASKRKLGEQEVNKHPEGEGGLNSVQRLVWQDSYSPLLGLTPADGGGTQSRAQELAAPRVLQDGWAGGAEDRRRGAAAAAAAANQSLIEQTDASEARDRLRMELLEV